MTRPSRSALVLDGQKVKLRLQSARVEGDNLIHVDWLRFTVRLEEKPLHLDKFFPMHRGFDSSEMIDLRRWMRECGDHPDWKPKQQALYLAYQVVEALGDGFSFDYEPRKGHDFYAARISILHEQKEVGWVGYGASSDGPRQHKQAQTLHVNLYGAACTFAQNGWRDQVADLIHQRGGQITRIDLALDCFDGREGGMEAIKQDYERGACNVGGKQPRCSLAGDWCNGKERSFYIGSRQAGKQTNVYEKGHQLFGAESGEKWMRFELRYGNKLRHIDIDALTNPDSYFAGASDWHCQVLAEQKAAAPIPLPCKKKLSAETARAAVSRVLNWFRTNAAPSLKVIFEHVSNEHLLEMFMDKSLPASLNGYSQAQISAAFRQIYPVGACPNPA